MQITIMLRESQQVLARETVQIEIAIEEPSSSIGSTSASEGMDAN